MPPPADIILTTLCGRVVPAPLLLYTDCDRIPVLSFKLEIADREPALYAPIIKRFLLIGGKDADPATDPALRAAAAWPAGLDPRLRAPPHVVLRRRPNARSPD